MDCLCQDSVSTVTVNHLSNFFSTILDKGLPIALQTICGIVGENRPTGVKFPMEIIDL